MYSITILVGRLTKDPELRQTPNGVAVTTFSIAVNRPRSKTDTDFIDIVAWRYTAEFVCRYFKKGNAILVEGYIQTREFTDKNGVKRRIYEVVADQARFTGEKKDLDVIADNNFTATGSVEDFTEIDDDGDLPF